MKDSITKFIRGHICAWLLSVLCACVGEIGAAGRVGCDDDHKKF